MTPGNNGFKIEYTESVVRSDIPDLPTSIRERIKKAINERLSVDPISYGKPLRFSFKGCRRLRVGDYRVVYIIDFKSKTVIIASIGHRKIVYNKLIDRNRH